MADNQTINLADYTIRKKPVKLPGDRNFLVRGLCMDDFTFLIQEHLDAISRAVTTYQESSTDIAKTGSMDKFIMLLCRDFPGLVAEVISAATDSLDEKTRGVARKLPLTVQIVAIGEIVNLTLEDAGGLGNLLAEMQGVFNDAASIVSGMRSTARPKTK